MLNVTKLLQPLNLSRKSIKFIVDGSKLKCCCPILWPRKKYLAAFNLCTDRRDTKEVKGNLKKIRELLRQEISLAPFIKDNYKYWFSKKGILWSLNDPNKRFNEPDGDSDQNHGDGQNHSPNHGANFLYWALGFFVLSMILKSAGNGLPETSWPVFLRLMLQAGEVQKVTVSSNRDTVYVYLKQGAMVNGRETNRFGPDYTFSIGNLHQFEERLRKAQQDLGIDSNDFIPVNYEAVKNDVTWLEIIVFAVLLVALVSYLMGGKGMKLPTNFTNPFSRHTSAKMTVVLPGTRKEISFKEVAGMQEAKQEVMEFVEYLQRPEKFKELGAKMPKGALLCGPPGTGKTLLAKAVATESVVPFLSMAGSDFVEMFSGVGAARVRDLFAQARKMAPCIVYIDEIDAIGRARHSAQGGNSEQESTLNQLLVEMDGMNSVEGVVMLASTNRPDILDQALLRPGRFDRNITIDLPTLPERKDIFMIYLKQLKLGQSWKKYSERLAELTPGKSGADIANICNEAALHAARLNNKNVDDGNFEYAIERVIAGIQKRSNTMSPEERRTVAYHEAGHAIVNWMLQYTEPVLKISIVPRTSAPLGYTQKFPLDIKLHTNEQLFDMMCAHLGGRVAEASVFGRITTGAEDDLKHVTDMAYQQIVTFGMNERLGPISFRLKKYTELSRKPYSDAMARVIDEEARMLVERALCVTKRLIEENKHKLDKLANELLEKEVVNHDTLVKLIGAPPHGDKREAVYRKHEAIFN